MTQARPFRRLAPDGVFLACRLTPHAPRSTVAVVAGHTQRLKSVHIAGDAALLEKRITAWLARFA